MWGVKDVQEYTGLSRKAVIHILESTDAPCLPRSKGQTFRVPPEAFVNWWTGGQYQELRLKK